MGSGGEAATAADNGKVNDNMLIDILSPHAEHGSAVTDCVKLQRSTLGAREMVLIYAFDAWGYSAELAVDAFERLAAGQVRLGARLSASFSVLVHPVHRSGGEFGCEILGPAA